MKYYRRGLRYLKPYWKHTVVSIISMVIFASLSGALIWMVGPLAGTLFVPDSPVTGGLKSTQPVPGLAVGSEAQRAKPWYNIFDQLKETISEPFQRFFHHPSKRVVLERLCFSIIIIVLLKGLFFYLQGYLMAYVQQSVIRDLRNDLYQHYHRLSLAFFNRARTGQLISRITNDVTILNDMLEMALTRLIRDPILVLVFVFSMVVISWQLMLITAVAFLLIALAVNRIGKAIHRYSRRSQEQAAEMHAAIQEAVSGMRIVKAFGAEKFEIEKFKTVNNTYRRVMLKMGRVRILSSPLNEILLASAMVFILWYAGGLILGGQFLRPEEFVLFLFFIIALIPPMKNLSQVQSKIQEGRAASQRIFGLMDTRSQIVENPGAVPLERFVEAINFHNVSFCYDSGHWVLREINLQVKVGEVIAIVGRSGAGKSTLMDLLARFYDPTIGNITIDGIDLRDVKIESLRQLIGIVSQETILFHDTVFNNIAYGFSNMSEDRVINCARAANAHEFIQKMEHGYQTKIGDRGVRLSGGQRQRLAIARALLKDPPILILDEATSALDSESEQLLQEAIARLVVGRTTFLIAHRLSSVLQAHRIIVLEQGRIVESGPHVELVQKGGRYQQLYAMQFSATL